MVQSQWGNQDNDEVDQLLLNAQLRNELEPYLDESVDLVNVRNKTTAFENEYLASMLAWERAPVLPICQWFEPTLTMAPPENLTWREIHQRLWETIHSLYEKKIVLEYTEHLSDYQLYCLILRDILPSHEKKLGHAPSYLHWHCLDPSDDPDTWLRFLRFAAGAAAMVARDGRRNSRLPNLGRSPGKCPGVRRNAAGALLQLDRTDAVIAIGEP